MEEDEILVYDKRERKVLRIKRDGWYAPEKRKDFIILGTVCTPDEQKSEVKQ